LLGFSPALGHFFPAAKTTLAVMILPILVNGRGGGASVMGGQEFQMAGRFASVLHDFQLRKRLLKSVLICPSVGNGVRIINNPTTSKIKQPDSEGCDGPPDRSAGKEK